MGRKYWLLLILLVGELLTAKYGPAPYAIFGTGTLGLTFFASLLWQLKDSSEFTWDLHRFLVIETAASGLYTIVAIYIALRYY